MALQSFRAVRWLRTLNLVLQAALFVTFFAGLNYVARNHPSRFDLTRHRTYSLSPETLSYIRNLTRPVHLVATLSDLSENPEVRGLLDEFVHATQSSPFGVITREFIDVYRDRRRAEELGIEQPNVILLRSGEKSRAVQIDELYRFKQQEREAFIGEQVLTAALLDVSDPSRRRVYFLTGHGELALDNVDPSRGLSLLRDQLRVRNFDVMTLELSAAKQIPADAALLIAVAPQSAYTPAEQELLRQHLTVNAGRLILLLGPGLAASRLGLDELLLDWGIIADDSAVIDPAPESITEDGDLLIRALEAKHPVMQTLAGFQTMPLRLGATRTVRVDPGRPATGLTVVPLAATSPQAWGEVGYRQLPFTRDGADIRPMKGIPPEDRLSIAVASERVSVRDNLPFSVRGGRLVVFGTGDLVSNQRIGYSGNFVAFLGAVNWTVDRDKQLNVPARPIERFGLALSAADFTRLRYALVLGLPGATLLLGLLVYWTRRS